MTSFSRASAMLAIAASALVVSAPARADAPMAEKLIALYERASNAERSDVASAQELRQEVAAILSSSAGPQCQSAAQTIEDRVQARRNSLSFIESNRKRFDEAVEACKDEPAT